MSADRELIFRLENGNAAEKIIDTTNLVVGCTVRIAESNLPTFWEMREDGRFWPYIFTQCGYDLVGPWAEFKVSIDPNASQLL